MTGSSGDAARDRMQPPAFWRNLEARFRGLADPVWADTDAPARLHMSDGKVRGGDASLRSRFKNVAGLGGMALCADRGFGADVFDGVWMWEDAVTAYLKEEKNPWYTECRSTRWKPGPAEKQELEKQELALSAIRPRHDEPHYTVDEALLFDEWVERIQREGMNVLLIVAADNQGYVVIDDEHEDLKYRACVLAGVTSLTCELRSASNPGARRTPWSTQLTASAWHLPICAGDLKRRRLDGRLRLLSSGQRRVQTGVRLRRPWPRPPLGARALMIF